ncbi:hypothetical protein GCM10009647_018400 [Streptomyces sanglieri]
MTPLTWRAARSRGKGPADREPAGGALVRLRRDAARFARAASTGFHLGPDRIHLDPDRKRPAPGVPEAGRFLG